MKSSSLVGHAAALLLAAGLAAVQAAAAPPDPMSLWRVTPPINYTDELYAGWPQLEVDKEIEVYNGRQVGRTYAHHPALYHDGNRTYLMHSTAPIDEDTTGQDTWLTTSTDGGMTWSPSAEILPPALLPNQSVPANYSYYCSNYIWMRALHPDGWVPVNDKLYAVSQTTLRYCWPGSSGTKAAGRIARAIGRDGQPVGDPCWTEKSNWTDVVEFDQTVYGTRYGMKMCDDAAAITAYLKQPATTPAWGTWLYQTKLYAADDTHDMQEVTHAVWFQSPACGTGSSRSNGAPNGYWERFWRDISSAFSGAVWVERTAQANGSNWYPAVEAQHGNAIYQTNIPDTGTKQHLGLLASGDRYLVHNPRNNTQKYRQPLTIATSRGSSRAYTGVGVLRTNASTTWVPDTRNLKRPMLSYPTAVEVGGKLIVSYSENKENIWVSIIDLKNLP